METKKNARTIELSEASALMIDALRKAYESLELASKALSEHYESREDEETVWHGVCDAYGQYKDKLEKTLFAMMRENMSWLENGTICARI